MNKSLGEQAKDRFLTEEELLMRHKSFVAEYFTYDKENKSQILKDALRSEIEKVELKLLKSK